MSDLKDVLYLCINLKIKKIRIMDNKDKVVAVFQNSDKPLKSGEIAEKTGIDSKEIGKIIKTLKTEGVIDSPKRCYYAIKK